MTKNGKNTKPSKAERQLKVVENAAKNEAQERIAQPNVLELAKQAPEDQKPAPEAKTEDQKPAGEVTKKKKAPSAQVKNWKAQKAFPMDYVITEVSKDNPKRKDAARRFAHYKEGQTVQEYTDVCGKDGITKALAMADMRWDHVAGFVTIIPKK